VILSVDLSSMVNKTFKQEEADSQEDLLQETKQVV